MNSTQAMGGNCNRSCPQVHSWHQAVTMGTDVHVELHIRKTESSCLPCLLTKFIVYSESNGVSSRFRHMPSLANG